MASIYAFCLPYELTDWISQLMTSRRLVCLVFAKSSPYPQLVEKTDGIREAGEMRGAYLMRANDTNLSGKAGWNSLRPRAWGWIDIRPGPYLTDLDPATLLMSEIHGEASSDGDAAAKFHVEWLRRRLRGMQLRMGVIGRNLVSGERSKYGSIGFTNEALQVFEQGALWKQSSSGNVCFCPNTER